ncbi:MAG: sigma-70 family RNA polymerase sigma factor [Planctomycetes bacterium]|nr:sigma-70 family RNA polymerase sigma factor [Planctomycetota bacterium]
MNPERERALIADSARGDQRAFADLVRLMAPDLIRGLTRILRDADRAEEISQLAFLRAWRNLDRLRDPRSFRMWLWQIARCAAFDALRRRFRPGDEVGVLDELPAEALAVDAPGIGEELARRELAEEALRELQVLPDEALELLRLRYEQELSYREMAERLGLTVTQVKARLARCRAALRVRLERIAAEWRRLDAERS